MTRLNKSRVLYEFLTERSDGLSGGPGGVGCMVSVTSTGAPKWHHEAESEDVGLQVADAVSFNSLESYIANISKLLSLNKVPSNVEFGASWGCGLAMPGFHMCATRQRET
jgi:hypothetical protein